MRSIQMFGGDIHTHFKGKDTGLEGFYLGNFIRVTQLISGRVDLTCVCLIQSKACLFIHSFTYSGMPYDVEYDISDVGISDELKQIQMAQGKILFGSRTTTEDKLATLSFAFLVLKSSLKKKIQRSTDKYIHISTIQN